MKRTQLKRGSGFKRKPTVPIKRSKLKKVSKQPISRLQKKLWDECKRIIRKNYPNMCYTCPRSNLSGVNWHTGHMWAKGSLGAYLKYDLRVLRPQCYNCNMNLGGMGAEFYKRMLKDIGLEEMEKLEKDKQVTVNAYDHYKKLLNEYKEL
jgi:hypothetical protein